MLGNGNEIVRYHKMTDTIVIFYHENLLLQLRHNECTYDSNHYLKLCNPTKKDTTFAVTRNVRRGGINSFEVPNSFGCTRKMVSQETTSIFSIKCGSKAPFISRERTQVAYLNSEEITWLGWDPILVHHPKWPTEIMTLLH